jgi:LacI family transcriptional regulator
VQTITQEVNKDLASVSLQNVADKAGVSAATVSRVLNGKKEDRIPAQTRDRVRLVAQELGYQPNRFARSLREGKTRTLGLMIAGLANPFFVNVMEAAERNAKERGYEVMLDAGHSIRGSFFEHGKLSDWPVDGVVMWARPDQNLAMFVGRRAQGLPVVYLGSLRDDGADAVTFDTYRGMREVVDHLADRGYRNLSYVAPYDFRGKDNVDERVTAFLDGCRERGCTAGYTMVYPQEETRMAGRETGLRIAAMPASERPRALVCHNDIIAVGVYHGLRRGGLRIPEDIAVVGFDGIEDGQCLDAPLTTVVVPVEEVTAVAMDILASRLTNDHDGRPRQVNLKCELLVGETT